MSTSSIYDRDKMLLRYIKKSNKIDAIILIFLGANVNYQDYLGNTALFYAIEKNMICICIMLIRNGANVNIKNNMNYTPLIYAIQICHGNKHIVNLLLSNGANPNNKDKLPYTALFYAIDKNLIDICIILIENGADVNIKYINGYTPLIYAIAWRHPNIEIINLLLDNGADINLTDNSNRSPLMFAINNIQIFEALLNRKPNLNIHRMQDNQTVLITAVRLVTKDCDYLQSFKIVELIINAGADVNAVCMNNRTALNYAVRNGLMYICKIIIAAEGNVNCIDTENNDTLLHIACRNRNLELAIFLTEHMACDKIVSLNLQNKSALEVWDDIIDDSNKEAFRVHVENLMADIL